MARRRVDLLRHPRGGSVAAAVVRRAQERAALHHPPRDRRARRDTGHWSCLAPNGSDRSTRAALARARRTSRRSTPRRCRSCRRARIRWPGTTRPARSTRSRRPARFCMRELALPDVGHVHTAGCQLVAPGVLGAFASRRAPRTPTRPRSAGTCRPRSRRPPRPPRQRGRPDGCPARSGPSRVRAGAASPLRAPATTRPCGRAGSPAGTVA